MKFTRGNLAIIDHIKGGKRIFLFEQTRKGYVQFKSELTFFNCDYYPAKDTEGKERIAIKFFFKRTGALVTYELGKTSLIEELPPNYFTPTVTERSGLVVSRVGQGAYRKSIINRWENQCAVTGFTDSRILIASHIHPWKDATNEERLDVSNGILLSPTYDALFDRHLITFDNNGKIVLGESVKTSEFEKIGVTGKERITKLSADNILYLNRHQAIFNTIT
ncbi:MAG: HNH endonuclease [Bacteroidetes bacterium]|nr:HNH endonuclease [Bacteroidota bacterium]